MLQRILEEHLEELEALWLLRQEAVRSPDYVLEEMSVLESRLNAHTQALAYAGGQLVPQLSIRLREGDRSAAFAATFALLGLRTDEANHCVVDALREAKGEPLEGIAEALCHATIEAIAEHIRDALDSAPATIAAAAAEVLAFHRMLDAADEHLSKFMRSEDPHVRQQAWRIVALLEQ